jgi:hypothetical protein
MKYMLSMTLLAAVVMGCDDHESFDNNVYINASLKTNGVLLKSTIEAAERTFQVALAKPEERDVTLTVKADASLVGTYNEGYYDKALMLPDGHYTISDPEVTINAGSVRSTDITLSFNNLNDLDREQKYVLPVTIGKANVGILQSARTMYYVFKAAALINVVADLEKNNAYVDWAKPEVVTGMRRLTAEALIYARNFDKMLSTVMGIEGQFLIRIGDAGIPSNQLQIATSKGNFTSSDLAIPVNEWVHIAMTYDADAKEINVYINGKNLYTTTTADAGAVNWGVAHSDESDGKPRCFWIGYSYDGNRYLAGMISECRIWNRVLTHREINATNHFYEVEPDAEGLAAYWKFDDGGGQKIADYSVNENHATVSDPVTWTPVELPANK